MNTQTNALNALPAAAHGSAHVSRAYRTIGKRALDIGLALLIAPTAAVLILVIALVMYKTRDSGTLFFGHRRIGRDGKAFRCWKIRTMVMDAENRLKAHLAKNPEAAKEWRRDHKLDDDPRVTRLGAFLRSSSLDELPQVWNVLKGEMSFVGPRPIVRSELHRYGAHRGTYLSVKPGVTGLWQVSGRNNVSYEDRVMMDVAYVNSMSLSTDIGLFFKTAWSILSRTGK